MAYMMPNHDNMGVKRSVWISAMHLATSKVMKNYFCGSKIEYIDFDTFPLYFLKFPLYNVGPY